MDDYTLVFDTETTGLWQNTLKPLNKQPKVIEFFALALDSATNEVLFEYESLVKVDEKITPKVTKLTTITNEMLTDAPYFGNIAPKVKELIENATAVVAHNLNFDIQMIEFEFQRLGVEIKWPNQKICTVEKTEHIEGYRLSLSNLHEKLFGEKFEGAHRAGVDVRALAKCYIELKNLGEI